MTDQRTTVQVFAAVRRFGLDALVRERAAEMLADAPSASPLLRAFLNESAARQVLDRYYVHRSDGLSDREAKDMARRYWRKNPRDPGIRRQLMFVGPDWILPTHLAKGILLKKREDIEWVMDTHLHGLRGIPRFKSCVLLGNEDAPYMIVCYDRLNPLMTSVPVVVVAFRQRTPDE